MRILHICESINQGGGIASFVCDLSGEQAKDNDVTVAVINTSAGAAEVKMSDNVCIHRFDKQRLGFSIKYPVRIYKYIKAGKFDIVHIHSAFLYFALSVILLHTRTKFVYTIHSDAKYENSSRWDRYFFWLKKLSFKRGYIKPITISQASKSAFENLYKVDSHLIYNGIKQHDKPNNKHIFDKYRKSDDTLIFLHPGRITQAKNQVTLCKVFKQLIDKQEDVVLIIAGTIQDQKIYSDITTYFSDRIVYIGERSDVIDLLYESDAMCLCSIWEGLPITLLEAMSVGCIPICSPVGGIPEVINDGGCGLLSQSYDADDYCDTIQQFIRLNKHDRLRISKNCIKRFDDYNITNTSRAYVEYYNSLINNTKE